MANFSLARHAREAVKLGFSHMEIGYDVFQTFQVPLGRDDLDELREIREKESLSYSCHFPFYSVDLAGPNEFVRKGGVNAMADTIERLSPLDDIIDCYVIHHVGENTAEVLKFIGDIPAKAEAVNMFRDNAISSLNYLIEKTKIDPKRIAVENIEFPLVPTLEIIEAAGTRFCLDTAHLLGGMAGKLDLMEVLERNFDILGEIHLQEFRPNSPMDDHAPLGESGQIGADFFNLLIERKFSGPVVFELPYPGIKSSVEYIRKICPEIRGLPRI